MNKRRSTLVALGLMLTLAATGCAKKNPKPVHTEPWLAHPPASAAQAASADATVPTTRYVLTERSQLRFELSTKRGKVRGKLTRVTGELHVALGALEQSRGELRCELDSLSLDDDNPDSAAWLTRARSALAVGATQPPTPSPVATFELSALSDVSPASLEPGRANDGGTPTTRRVRATAEGSLLLNGFRVLKREPLEAEFGFGSDLTVPGFVVIRSRTPLVVSLETHEIHLREPSGPGADRHGQRPPAQPHDVRVSIELYGTKD